MNQRFIPPLHVIIVGRPESPDWCSTSGNSETVTFFDELFRCLSYDIRTPRATNPAIPVYFSIEDFSPAKSRPHMIDVALARCTIVFVLLDSKFLEDTEGWTKFFTDMRERAKESSNNLQFIPMARTYYPELQRHIQRLGLERASPIRPYDDNSRRFFRITAMIAAIQKLRSIHSGITVFISYARRDDEGTANRIRNAIKKYSGMDAIVDSMAFSPGAPVEVELLEQGLVASTCVVVLETDSYAERVWCQREAVLALKCDAPIVVVDMVDSPRDHEQPGMVLQRRSGLGLPNCLKLRMSVKTEVDVENIVEYAVAETLRIVHHRSRGAALLALAGIDPQRVEILARPPELLPLLCLKASNVEATSQGRRPKNVVLHPDPPLTEGELKVLRLADPNFQFITPSTILSDMVAKE